MTGSPIVDVVRFMTCFRPPDPDYTPRSIRMAPNVMTALYTHPPPEPPLTAAVAPTHLYGLDIIVDPSLPPGVWRLVDVYGRLIRDSRSTNPPE